MITFSMTPFLRKNFHKAMKYAIAVNFGVCDFFEIFEYITNMRISNLDGSNK